MNTGMPSREILLESLDPENPAAQSFLCAGHAMKETLSVSLARKGLEIGVRLAGATVGASTCISDGGDGFLEAFQAVRGGSIVESVARDPLGHIAMCPMLVNPAKGFAAIEMARCCGLAMVPANRRSVMRSGTASLADLIGRAVSQGLREIHVGLGGSATCDGGLGMLMRLEEMMLGTLFSRNHFAAEHLGDGSRPNLPELRRALEEFGVRMVVYCDVQNPLLGPTGAARLFAPQKGATPEQVDLLERWLEGWARDAEAMTGADLRQLPGAGAAGGVGFAFAALGCELHDGAGQFFELVGLREKLAECDGLITCEGRFDKSSLVGKAPWKAARAARVLGKRAVIACGEADDDARSEAAKQGVEVIVFGRDVPVERRSAEAFDRLSQSTRRFLAGIR
jgi:glycerate kinase